MVVLFGTSSDEESEEEEEEDDAKHRLRFRSAVGLDLVMVFAAPA